MDFKKTVVRDSLSVTVPGRICSPGVGRARGEGEALLAGAALCAGARLEQTEGGGMLTAGSRLSSSPSNFPWTEVETGEDGETVLTVKLRLSVVKGRIVLIEVAVEEDAVDGGGACDGLAGVRVEGEVTGSRLDGDSEGEDTVSRADDGVIRMLVFKEAEWAPAFSGLTVGESVLTFDVVVTFIVD